MSGSFTTDLATLSFAAMMSPTAFPFDEAWAETEELTAAGVSNIRWRKIRDRFDEWAVDCIAQAATYAAAAGLARNYQSASGEIGGLSLTAAGTTYNWTRVHAELVSYQIITGPIVGVAVSGGSAACHVRSSWRFRLTELSQKP